MNAETLDFEIPAIVVVSHAIPRAGDECVIAADGSQTGCRIKSIVLEPVHSSLNCGSGPVPWVPSNRLASIQILVPGSAGKLWMADGEARHITLSDAGGRTTIGDGFTVGWAVVGRGSAGRTSPVTRGLTVWMTGLSGAGKTTIATQLERVLRPQSRVEVLDADVVRTHICKGLGFTEQDRRENVWRLALAASALAGTGATVLVSAISPYRTAREQARNRIGRFIEVYVNAPLSICEGRDVKGLYKRARNGEIHQFTGIDDPYEPPLDPEVECRTDAESVSDSVAKIVAAISRERERWIEAIEPSSALGRDIKRTSGELLSLQKPRS